MCGIAGFISNKPHSEEFLEEAVNKLDHRGPDSNGIYLSTDSCVGFAHTRLAIQDLSIFGNQPMNNYDNTLSIIFNGEIYNHFDLREKFFKNNQTFLGDSDTETILALY